MTFLPPILQSFLFWNSGIKPTIILKISLSLNSDHWNSFHPHLQTALIKSAESRFHEILLTLILAAVVQSPSHVPLFATPRTVACQEETPQVPVHCISDAIQPSHSLLPSSPSALNLSPLQRLFQRIGSSHRVAKILVLQASVAVLPTSVQSWSPLIFWLVWSPCCKRDIQESSAAPQLEDINSFDILPPLWSSSHNC